MTEIRDLVKEFGERTLSNLDFIHRNAKEPGVFEVTQLWNSLSGLLVLPYEHELEAIDATLADAVNQGWPELEESFPLDSGRAASESLADQVRRLRNAVSHYNVKFRSKRGVIVGVTVWNHRVPPRGSDIRQRDMPINWQADVSIAQLDQLARTTAALYANNLRLSA